MIETFLSGIELMGKGGIMMFPIFLASIIAFAIIIERLIFFKKSKENPDEILKTIKNLVDNKNPPTTESSQANEGPISRMLAVGAQAQKEPLWKVEEKLAVSGREEIQGLRKNLRGLEVIATISPLMGLLGTVMGMVKAFNKVAQYKGQVDPSLLAGGIWEALLTTAAGLAIAIPIVIMLNYFERKVESITILLEKYGQYLIHHLHEEQSESTKGNSPSAGKPGASPELTEQRV
ncbi:MAG: MotA/TolQ/ExbB proton channel family protein [Nitrospinaceae bacterium]|nr:MotA/TolQ/ExbB proton channel family protein [Nitrospinaceae bacterium]